MKTGIVKDRRFANHDMGPFHVESPRRIEELNQMVEEEIHFPYLPIEPRTAVSEEILRVHSSAYFEFLRRTSGRPPVMLDPDTSTSPDTFETALLAAGGGLKAVELIMEGRIRNAFALIRPPGHHAEAGRAMGFCFFNNIAVAAEHLIQKFGCRKVLIADWDVHHGNGTQNAFYDRNDVLYFSFHQTPLFPGTGGPGETGRGKGAGFTLNFPLLSGKGDEDLLWIYQRVLLPVAEQFKPEFILVSAGFDISECDPLGGMRVSAEGFGRLTAALMEAAGTSAQDRLALFLEGGYDLPSLKAGVKEVLLRLAGEVRTPVSLASITEASRREIEPLVQVVRKHWKL